MPSPPPIYCIDTSSIFEWYVRTYPPAIFESLPAKVEALIEAGRLRSPKAVLDEIKPGDDCHTWAKAQTDLFIEESASVQGWVRKIMAQHHNPLKPLKGIGGADPFVIGLALDGELNKMLEGSPSWVVVSNEHPGSAESRKIPFVCKAEGVECVTFQELMLREGWKF